MGSGNFSDLIRKVREEKVSAAADERISVTPDPELGRIYTNSIPDGFRCLGIVRITNLSGERRGALLRSRTSGEYWMRSNSPDVTRHLSSAAVVEAIGRKR